MSPGDPWVLAECSVATVASDSSLEIEKILHVLL